MRTLTFEFLLSCRSKDTSLKCAGSYGNRLPISLSVIVLQDYVVSIFMRQKWQDTRLAFAHLSNESMVILDARLADAIWLPDLFFTNEKSAYFHSVTKPNRFLRLHKNGTLYYSARYDAYFLFYLVL